MEMEQRLCRLCAAITTHPHRVDIFAVDGLRHKIETCLPIHVWKESELPDTLCTACLTIVDSFYAFRKRSLETLAIFEAKFHSIRTCFTNSSSSLLKTQEMAPPSSSSPPPQQRDQATSTDNLHAEQTQFGAWREKQLGHFCLDLDDDGGKETRRTNAQQLRTIQVHIERAEEILDAHHHHHHGPIVDYGDSEPEAELPLTATRCQTSMTSSSNRTNIHNKLYFDDTVNDIISEIVERKSKKRKLEVVVGGGGRPTKVMRMESASSRRKKRAPMKRGGATPTDGVRALMQNVLNLPQVCLLCDQQMASGTLLARHVFETHGIDMAQVISSEPVPEKQQAAPPSAPPLTTANLIGEAKKPAKKLPELVKITDLKSKRESSEAKSSMENNDAPPTLTASYVCPLCPASLTNKCDLYAHLRLRHGAHAKLICGLCMHIASSTAALQEHVDACERSHPPTGYFVCAACKYSEDNQKSLENHVLVHDFLIGDCKKAGRIFDPADFVDANAACEPKMCTCGECATSFASFKEFSSHRRAEHSIFHCDLCNKSYGRNSHLWKHVNRVHKGHPSVTCQFCYKTSASKYHLLQHFNKIHTQKTSTIGNTPLTISSLSATIGGGGGSSSSSSGTKMKNGDGTMESGDDDDDFMNRKFEAFDFQSVRQSFMRQEMARKATAKQMAGGVGGAPPKELDSSSTIYTNIITNYTPPTNDGEFKCPKCMKAFHKRTLLKKHKKNCRPRLQKDLLTRCKSCSRIFKDRQSLAKHLVNYHSEYACEICGEKVQSKCEIVSHIRFTHPECHLNCTDCGNVLRNNDLLRGHLADHGNSHVCQFCGDILPSKIKLKMHVLSLHRKILSLSCGVCLKLFESQHILRDHVRLVHRDALQPLTSCTVCGKNYGSKWKTYDHLNKSHGRVFRACKFCLEVFNNEQELQVHCEAAHTKAGKKVMSMNGVEQPQPQLEYNNHSMMMEHDEASVSKPSLLMKHLVGDTTTKSRNVLSNGSTPPKMVKLKMAARPLTPCISSVEAADASILSSCSSKRTVYVNSNDPSRCDICHKNWPAKKHLWQHYIRCHKEVAATVCGICLSTNASYESLQRHLQREHPNLLHGQGFGSNFICRICGRYHNASSKLRLHMAIHTKFNWSLLDGGSGAPSGETKMNEVVAEEEEDEGEEEEEGEVEVKCEEDDDDDDDDDDIIDEEEEEEDDDEGEEGEDDDDVGVTDEVNYESLMEQVEGSTNSSSSSSETEDEEDEEEEEDDENDENNAEGEVVAEVYTKDKKEEAEEEEDNTETVKIPETDEANGSGEANALLYSEVKIEAEEEDEEENYDEEIKTSTADALEVLEEDEEEEEEEVEEENVQVMTPVESEVMEHVMYDTVEEVVHADGAGAIVTDGEEEDEVLQEEYIEEDDDEEDDDEDDDDEETVAYVEDDVPVVEAETTPPREFDVRSRNNLNQHEIQSAVDSIL